MAGNAAPTLLGPQAETEADGRHYLEGVLFRSFLDFVRDLQKFKKACRPWTRK